MMWGLGGNYGYGGGAWLGMGLMMLFGLLVLVGVVLLIIWAVRAASGTGMGMGMHGGGTADACDIAKTRYARGEISKEEYFEICRNIGAHHS